MSARRTTDFCRAKRGNSNKRLRLSDLPGFLDKVIVWLAGRKIVEIAIYISAGHFVFHRLLVHEIPYLGTRGSVLFGLWTSWRIDPSSCVREPRVWRDSGRNLDASRVSSWATSIFYLYK